MVSAVFPGASIPGSNPDQRHCVVCLANRKGVTVDGLSSRPGGVELLLVISCYKNWDYFRWLRTSWLQGFNYKQSYR